MSQSLWISKTGLDAQQTRMSTIANNLANVGTTGFKRSRAIFEDLVYQNVRQVGAQSSQDTLLPSGLQIGTGTRVVATEKLFTQGNLTKTDNSLDLAIQGRGFFEILLPDGTQGYTRDGSLQINDQGIVVTSAGYQLQPPITIPQNATSISIGGDGTVSVTVPGSAAVSQVGNIQLTDFINPAGLQARGENLLVESGASGAPQPGNPGINGLGTVVQGYVESSNVNVVEELVNMIETQRAYEMNSKAISTADQMLQFVSNNL
ncbi:MAG TPA: flagellar basal-body rod protein FlgG [Halieaceae bacterium]|jgi:flagellar basal-body rod protein FlgG|uniref:Flagellar basal-body rod protein FlgG n=1 Tax=Haliea salexigens TaxID=287487 RepID=A0A3C1KLN3_9GAMM|nr:MULTISPECIES: flagellar basal-body rod protein FlgG [Haliea]MCR9184111.1 flagellar basal-body rod protein FlgG [Halieaceae bacterium]HAN27587.1 flagellar basal-body rod protein FlgG [Haliea salexigens]MAY91431.1 flagellar basal-body rod protein FlgG [Haliea sp.]MBK41035.1 flagellar basal-body rod protein FlgG [Haliea sp.]MBP71055.1 flagellar basal-body rod protein FlgG [Haliea sp.]|tara:strand:+ start:775 stop:1560 length:786 start_codon:yes stop_codon:yes gene_type:complete